MSKQTRRWSPELIIQFLELYEQYPCLWNPKISTYKDKNKRDEALKEIVEVMSPLVQDFDVNYAKSKIRSIRNAYTLEHHKVLKSYKSDTKYKPTVFWFPVADRFLKHIVVTKDMKNTLESQVTQEAEESQETDENETYVEDFYVDETAVDTLLQSSRSPTPSTSSQTIENSKNIATKRKSCSNHGELPFKKTKHNEIEVFTKAVQDIANKISYSPIITDEYEAFGKTVAAHLRKLPNDVALESQSEILHFLVQKRLGRKISFSTSTLSPNFS